MKAWLLDGYAVPGAIRTWWITEQGERRMFQRRFSPTFYVGQIIRTELVPQGYTGSLQPWAEVQNWLEQRPAGGPAWKVQISQTKRMDLPSGIMLPVLAVQVKDPVTFAPLVRQLSRTFPWIQLFQADLPVVQYAFYMWEWYPTMWAELELDTQGWITAAAALDQRQDIDPLVPVLRFLSMRLDGNDLNPRHGKRGALVVRSWDSSVPQAPMDFAHELILEADDEYMYESLSRMVVQTDPDIILSEWGDDFLLPRLVQQAKQVGVAVPWNRDVEYVEPHVGQDHTYFSYGQVRHRAPVVTCFGRLHIDTKNSFLHAEGEVDGLFELARLSSLPVQRLARTTIGTAMSAMQLLTAMRRKVLIPMDKRQPEDWKTAEQLIVSDKGGLVYQPTLGFHENVLELDFASLYPAIMVRLNVSPETINCMCCAADAEPKRVPAIGYQVCTRRRGLVSETLEIILDKRAELKRRMRIPAHGMPSADDLRQRASYDRRQNTLKWILVTCFGYLGFKNARFGRIEAHESVTAFGRELLLRAKDQAEQMGFRFLHGIVDSIWLHKPGVTLEQAEELSQKIFELTKIEMKIEGIYHWIAFLPSKQDPLMPVANRYFGLFTSGEFKLRGIELRRHDTPQLVLRFQRALLDAVQGCRTISELRIQVPHTLEILEEFLEQVGRGTVPPHELVFTRRLSRDPRAYQNQTHTAIVAQELLGRGIDMSPGEMIQYVVTDARSTVLATRARSAVFLEADWSYDVGVYQDLLYRAFDSIFSQLGYDLVWLKTWRKTCRLECDRISLMEGGVGL